MDRAPTVLQEANDAGIASAPPPAKQTSGIDDAAEQTSEPRRGVRFPSEEKEMNEYEPPPTLSEAALKKFLQDADPDNCLLYTSDSADDLL